MRRWITGTLIVSALLSLLIHFTIGFGELALLWWENRGLDTPLVIKPTQRKLTEMNVDVSPEARAILAGVKPAGVQVVTLRPRQASRGPVQGVAHHPARPKSKLTKVRPPKPATQVAKTDETPAVEPVATDDKPVEQAKTDEKPAETPAKPETVAKKPDDPDWTPGESFPRKVRIVYVALGIAEGDLSFELTGDRYRSDLRIKIREFKIHSEGRVGKNGLIPEYYASTEGSDALPTVSAKLDWTKKEIVYGDRGEEKTEKLEDGTQDFLSSVFQLALYGGRMKSFSMPLTSGRRFYRADYVLAGETSVFLDGKNYTALLLKASNERGAADIYLSPDLYNLPLRFTVKSERGAIKQADLTAIHVEINGKTIIERPRFKPRDR